MTQPQEEAQTSEAEFTCPECGNDGQEEEIRYYVEAPSIATVKRVERDGDTVVVHLGGFGDGDADDKYFYCDECGHEFQPDSPIRIIDSDGTQLL